MILIIRIGGLVDINSDIEEALFRMRLRRKYSAILLQETPENLSLIDKVRNFVAFGPVDEKTLAILLEKRAKVIGKNKLDVKSIIAGLESQSKKGKLDLSALGIKPFFRLHPPIKGIDSKIHFGRKKGVLGDNKEKINDLVRRML
jgi:large subunit ribosomal protein L30